MAFTKPNYEVLNIEVRNDITSVENHVNVVSALLSTQGGRIDVVSANTTSVFNYVVALSATLRSDITSARNQVSSALTASSLALQTNIDMVSNAVSTLSTQLASVSAALQTNITSVKGLIRTNLVSLADVSLNTSSSSDGYAVTWNNTEGQFVLSSISGGGGGGTGDVVGPAGATDNALSRYDGTTGKLIQNSNILGLDGGSLVLTPQTSVAHVSGQLFYDTDNQSLNFHNNEADVNLNIGQEMWIRVRNVTGSTILNGKAVYINGANSGLPTIALAQANTFNTALVAGLATHDIENNTIGYITAMGVVRGVNTASFTAGAALFLSETSAGDWKSTAPVAPNYSCRIGAVAIASAAPDGTIQVFGGGRQYGNGAANSFYMMDAGGTSVSWRTVADAASVIGLTAASAALRADITSARNQVSGAITALSATLRTDITSVYNFASNGLSVAAAARTSLRNDITSVFNVYAATSATLRSDITSAANAVSNQASVNLAAVSATLRTDITSVYNQLVSVSAVLRGDITSVETHVNTVSNAVSALTSVVGDKVKGPATATDNAIVRFDGTTGKLIQDSVITIADDGDIVVSNTGGLTASDVFILRNNGTTITNITGLGGQSWNLYNTSATNVGTISYSIPNGLPGIVIGDLGFATRRYDIQVDPGSGDSMRIYNQKNNAATRIGFGFNNTTPATAVVHVRAGNTSIAPMKFTSGNLLTSAEAGAVEFLTDKWYGTISTSSARKEFALVDSTLTSGSMTKATTNGRLVDAVPGTDYQVPVSLTTTSTAGVATLTSVGVLNIPNYSSGWRFISQVAGASVASIDITTLNNSLYFAYLVHVKEYTPVSDNTSLLMRISTNGGVNFTSTGYSTALITQTGSGSTNSGGSGQTSYVGANNTDNGTAASYFVYVTPQTFTSSTVVNSHGSRLANDGTTLAQVVGGGYISGAANAIQFFSSSGQINGAVAYLYGLRSN
jgi:hypothetical protein